MAQSNKRYFNTFFFEDPYIEDLDYHTRYLYLTMILNPHNNLAGCYELSINKLKQYTGMPEDRIRIGIQKLQEDRKILFSGTWISLKNFIKNNELNPNMCKNAFDIMMAAPKENILFIVSDRSGNAEPWLQEFVEKIESGINASINSKNRNAVSAAKRKGLPEPAMIPNQVFTMEHFASEIMKEQIALPGGRVPPSIPPSIPFSEGEPSGEYKEEREYEYKYEVEKEREDEIGNRPNAFEPYIPPEKNYSAIWENSRKHWNKKSNLPEYKRALGNESDMKALLNFIAPYEQEEITAAIDNYSELLDSIECKYGTFKGFMRSGVDQFHDGANPYERYKGGKEASQEEKEEFNRMLGEIYK